MMPHRSKTPEKSSIPSRGNAEWVHPSGVYFLSHCPIPNSYGFPLVYTTPLQVEVTNVEFY